MSGIVHWWVSLALVWKGLDRTKWGVGSPRLEDKVWSGVDVVGLEQKGWGEMELGGVGRLWFESRRTGMGNMGSVYIQTNSGLLTSCKLGTRNEVALAFSVDIQWVMLGTSGGHPGSVLTRP